MAGEVASLGNLILGIANTIQSLGNNWYVANAASKKFPGQVQGLQEKVDFWERETRNFPQLSLDAAQIERLHAARTLLQQEQVKLEKRDASRCSGCWAPVSMTVFPAKVGLGIQGAMEAFDDILGTLRSRQDTRDLLNKESKGTAVSDSIAADARYVHLVESEKKICLALEDAEGPGVVLLHGGPGFGKSTLARNMVVHYTNLPIETRKFDLVFFLNCGPGAKAEDTQLDIIRRLGSEPAASTQEASEKGVLIENQLRGLLTAQKVLLVLDDVFEGVFLHKIVKLCGTEVKCLVTAQRADLCQSVLEQKRYVSIQIQAVDHDTARKILACHLELPNHEIPLHLQGVADKMITETECIPLALSSLANVIDHNRSDKLDVWEDASAHFFEALQYKVPTTVLDGTYLKSFWATTKLAIDNLNEDAEKLLLLTHACEGPLVPEGIVQLLYRSKKLTGVVGNFSNARRQLVNRHLIKTSPSAENPGTEDSNWSMHSLLKRYIEAEMKERRDALFTSLYHDKDAAKPVIGEQIEDMEEQMVTTVCALYLEGELGERAASRTLRGVKTYVHRRRKKAIEPVTCLLGRIKSERWTDTARDYTMEVFVKYICNDGDLYGEGISYILGLPSAALTMLEALKDMTSSEWMFKLEDDENTLKLMNTLANQLAEGVGKGTQKTALYVLVNLIRRGGRGRVYVSNWVTESLKSLGVSTLEGNVRLLIANSDHQVQVLCAQLFESLVRCVRLSESLVEIRVGWGGVIASSVNSLQSKDSKVENHFLQIEMAKILRNIALSVPMAVKVDILNYPGLLPKLTWSLSFDDNSTLQGIVLGMLKELLDGVDQNKATIVNCESLLKELARLLKCKIGRLQVEIVRVFVTLAKVEDDSSKMKIKATRGIKECLITLSMSRPSESDNDQFPGELQAFAMEALTLLDHDQGNKQYLHFGRAYGGRALANSRLGLYTQALADLEEAHKLNCEAHKLNCYDAHEFLSFRYCIKAKMGDLEGAMEDMEEALTYEDDEPYYLQERGVIKRMMNDLGGALEDFNKALEEDTQDYEMLKHRGYVKFLKNDEDGARADAKLAIMVRPSRIDCDDYAENCLGTGSLEYLGYKLK